jgi:hypothetical protein
VSARSGADRWLLLQAVVWLGLLRAAILVVPFQWIARMLGLALGESPPSVDPTQTAEAERIGWAVRAAASRTPWQSACLAQALAGATLMRRRGLPGTLYLGVTKEVGAPGSISAHAWLRCGTTIVTGAAGHERYTIVAAFAIPLVNTTAR